MVFDMCEDDFLSPPISRFGTEGNWSDSWEGLCFPFPVKGSHSASPSGLRGLFLDMEHILGWVLGVCTRPGVHSSILKVSASAVVSSKAGLPCTHVKYVGFITFLTDLGWRKCFCLWDSEFTLELLSFVVYAEDGWEDMSLFVLPSLRLYWAHILHSSGKASCPF